MEKRRGQSQGLGRPAAGGDWGMSDIMGLVLRRRWKSGSGHSLLLCKVAGGSEEGRMGGGGQTPGPAHSPWAARGEVVLT